MGRVDETQTIKQRDVGFGEDTAEEYPEVKVPFVGISLPRHKSRKEEKSEWTWELMGFPEAPIPSRLRDDWTVSRGDSPFLGSLSLRALSAPSLSGPLPSPVSRVDCEFGRFQDGLKQAVFDSNQHLISRPLFFNIPILFSHQDRT